MALKNSVSFFNIGVAVLKVYVLWFSAWSIEKRETDLREGDTAHAVFAEQHYLNSVPYDLNDLLYPV